MPKSDRGRFSAKRKREGNDTPEVTEETGTEIDADSDTDTDREPDPTNNVLELAGWIDGVPLPRP